MGLQIEIILNQPDERPLLAGSVIQYRTTFDSNRVFVLNAEGMPELDAEGNNIVELQHSVIYSMALYSSKTSFEKNKPFVMGGIKEFDLIYSKILTNQEFLELANPASNTFAMVEGWLIEHLESKIGVGNIISINFNI